MNRQEQTPPGEKRFTPNRLALFFIHIMLPATALICGIVITFYLLETSPKAKPSRRAPTAVLVEVQELNPGLQSTLLGAMGEIIPARQVEIRPRVSGEITAIDTEFVPGGYFIAGQKMLSIDRADYDLIVRQLESEAAGTRSDLALEMGNQRIAERELSLLGETVSAEERDLILRRPQLEKLQAALSSAESRLAQARLDLERTEITAPFNGVIAERLVDTGTRVTESTVLATLVGTDAFWLQLSLPVEQLKWVTIPADSSEAGSLVRVYSQSDSAADSFRSGRVVRLVAALEPQGRMAQLLVRLDDPLCRRDENRGKPKLLLGSYVRAEIEGTPIAAATKIDRTHLHEDDTLWIMDENGLLDIRPVEIAFRSRDHIVVAGGVRAGEQLVTSALSAPVAGIPLRLETAAESEPADQPPGGGQGQSRDTEERRRAR